MLTKFIGLAMAALTLLVLVALGNAMPATSSPLSTFCDQFVQQCYKTALKGQMGEVSVSHSCQRNGDKYSTSFTYSCARNGDKITAKVLKALGQAFFRPSTTTVTEGGNQVVTEVIELVSTRDDIRTTRVTTSTATTTSTARKQVIDRVVETVLSTLSSTTIIPFTLDSTSSVLTTLVKTRTSTAYTTTQTEVFIDSAEVPVYQAKVIPAWDEAEVQKRAPSTFCLAYRIACQNECWIDSSHVNVEICEGTQVTSLYTMACICTNGKRKTQHVLEVIAEDRRIVSVTASGSTSTTYTTYTRTTTQAIEALTTRLVTMTYFITETSTFITSTATTDVTIEYTGISSATKTVVTTSTTPVTTSTVTYTTGIPTTTRLVLAATGYVHSFDISNGSDIGVLGRQNWTSYAAINSSSTSYGGNSSELMAIRDHPTGLYQLALLGQPMIVLYTIAIKGVLAESGSWYYSLLRFGNASTLCGPAGTAPGPPAGPEQCETFIFSPLALDSTPGATTETVSLRPFWINPTGSTPANFSGVWACNNNPAQGTIMQVADRAGFSQHYPATTLLWFTLRFPFPS